MIDDAASDHETWVESTTCYSTQGMPCFLGMLVLVLVRQRFFLRYHRCHRVLVLTIIKPVPERVETIFHEIFRGSEINPGVNWSPISSKCFLKRLQLRARSINIHE